MINKDLFQFVCCPKCKGDLKHKDTFFICEECGNKYEIQNDIPILVDLDNLPIHLQRQIKYFEGENKYNTEYKLDEWKKSYLDRFKDNFNEISSKLIIDCGTGSGYMAIHLAKLGANIIACDLTLNILIRLKEMASSLKLIDKIICICCNAEELPIKSKTVDYFVSNAVLEHLPKEKEAIKEINRVCGKRAGLMITVPLSYKFLNPWRRRPDHRAHRVAPARAASRGGPGHRTSAVNQPGRQGPALGLQYDGGFPAGQPGASDPLLAGSGSNGRGLHCLHPSGRPTGPPLGTEGQPASGWVLPDHRLGGRGNCTGPV